MNLVIEVKEIDALKELKLFEFVLRVQHLFGLSFSPKKIPSEVVLISLKFFHASESAPFRQDFGFPLGVSIEARDSDKTLLDGETFFVYRNKETGQCDWHHNELKNVDLEKMASAVVKYLIKWLEEK